MTLILNGTDNSATTPAVTGTDTDTGVYYPAANQVAIATSGTQAMLANASQGVQFANAIGVGATTPTTSGAGITFPATQSASTDANTLDDYEEGTFLPAFDIPSGSVTYATRTASYIKIGRLVQCTIALGFSAISSPSGNITITGMPFTAGSGELYVSAFSIALARNFSSALTITGYIGQSSATLQISKNLSNAGFSPLQGSDFTSSTNFYISISYMTA